MQCIPAFAIEFVVKPAVSERELYWSKVRSKVMDL